MQITKDESGSTLQTLTLFVICHSRPHPSQIAAAHLVRCQSRQRLSSRALRSLNVYRRQLLQLVPALPFAIGRLNNLTQQTSPLSQSSLDVAVSNVIINQLVTADLMFDQITNHLRGTRAIGDGQAKFKVARKIGPLILILANGS